MTLTERAPAPADMQPRLLRLPGEVRNIIFEKTAPTKNGRKEFIALHATRTPKQTVVFHPRQPTLASTCRQLRDEFPLHNYYSRNTFLVTASMMLPGRLEAFFAGRPLAARHLRDVRVDLLGIPWVDPQSRTQFLSAQSRIRFSARVATDGAIVLSRLKTRVCCCWITALAQQASRPGCGPEGRLAEFLLRYASKAHTRYAESRQSCPDCGLAKTGSDADDKNARIVLMYVLALFAVVFGFMTFLRFNG